MRTLAAILVFVSFFCSTTVAQWQQTSLDSVTITALFSDGTVLFAGTDDNGVYRSTNNGGTWVRDNGGLPESTVVYCFEASGSNIVMGMGGWIYRSTSAGLGWTLSSAGVTDTQHVYTLGVGGGSVYMSAAGGFYRSITNGTSWTRQGSDQGIACLLVVGGDLLGATNGGSVIRSTDQGVTWNPSGTGVATMTTYDLIFVGANIFLASYDGVFVSTNSGVNWSAANTNLTSPWIKSFAVAGTNLFAATGTGIFQTTNSGATWNEKNEGLSGSYFGSFLAIDGSYLYMGGTNGVWKRPLSEIVTSTNEMPGLQAKNFRLHDGFPNPFNATTKVSFSLPHRTFASLVVVDVLGREVERLAEREFEPGTHTMSWNASNAAGGTYFYRLSAEGRFEVKKILLLK